MYMQQLQQLLLATLLVAPFAACAPKPPLIPTSSPTSVESTASYKALRNLPAPPKPVPVAVYSYPDLTGQLKTSEAIANNSRAVTQGAVWMLVKSLKDAAGGRWFKVIQRANLENLLKERQIIRETRGKVAQQSGQPQPGLPSLMFAGVILEGGIIGYDSNTVSGGVGARYLGIGGDVQYRQDTVTVYLNAISSQTGEILKSVMTRKTVASYGVRGSVFKFVAFQKLLEGETGYTVNEPGQIAVAQAIEHAVRALIIEGALEGLWQFEDAIAGKEEAQQYLADKEDDILLGDASSDIAQALLTDEQLERLSAAREERRARLEEQAAERDRRASAEQKKQASEEQQQSANPAADRQQPTSAIKASLTTERLAAVVEAQQQRALKQMVLAVAPSASSPEPNAGSRRIGKQAPPTRQDISALHTLLAEFSAETRLLENGVQLNDEDTGQGGIVPSPAAGPSRGGATPISATRGLPATGTNHTGPQNGENL